MHPALALAVSLLAGTVRAQGAGTPPGPTVSCEGCPAPVDLGVGLRGTLAHVDGRWAVGWVVDPAAPGEWLDLELRVDGSTVAGGRAEKTWSGLEELGLREDCGFALAIPPALGHGLHGVEVFARRPASATWSLLDSQALVVAGDSPRPGVVGSLSQSYLPGTSPPGHGAAGPNVLGERVVVSARVWVYDEGWKDPTRVPVRISAMTASGERVGLYLGEVEASRRPFVDVHWNLVPLQLPVRREDYPLHLAAEAQRPDGAWILIDGGSIGAWMDSPRDGPDGRAAGRGTDTTDRSRGSAGRGADRPHDRDP